MWPKWGIPLDNVQLARRQYLVHDNQEAIGERRNGFGGGRPSHSAKIQGPGSAALV